MNSIETESGDETNELKFVKLLKDATDYRKDQKELIKKAIDIANGDPLNALKYIVSSLAHEGHEVEFHMVITVPGFEEGMSNNIRTELPIFETEPKDELGYYVSWGDGETTHNINSHVYKKKANDVDYEIKFFGLGIAQFGEIIHKIHNDFYECLTIVKSFGNLGSCFNSLSGAFSRCNKLSELPASIPSTVTDMSHMFHDSQMFNLSIESWDTKNCVNMSFMFSDCFTFNQTLGAWNTSSVTDMRSMFSCCFSFDQPINTWDTSSVTNMSNMFHGCEKFNQSLNSWDTSSVISMKDMFYYCSKFNKPIDTWDTSSVTDMSHMFHSCVVFNQPLNSWNTHSVVDMTGMFYRCAKFDQPLTSWIIDDLLSMFHSCQISDKNKPRIKIAPDFD